MQASSICQTRPERMLPSDFWVYSYKVLLCPIKHSHDWEKCIYAHEGEKARRRHPSKYQAVQCPEARAKKACPRGEECPCTHHLFEYWLHPDRYLTCLCELGRECNRPICFFAHHASELRPLPVGLSHGSPTGSRTRRAAAAAADAATAQQLQARAVSPNGLSSSVAVASRSSSPGVSIGVVAGAGGLAVRQLSSGSLLSQSSVSPPGSGTIPAFSQTGLLNGSGSSTSSGYRPGFAALNALSTSPHGGSGGSSGGATASQSCSPPPADGGRRAVVLQSPLLDAHPLLQQATQHLQQLRVGSDTTTTTGGWGTSSSPATTIAPSGSNMSLASSCSTGLTPTGSMLAAAIHQQQQQQQFAAVNAAGGARYSPCNSQGPSSNTSMRGLSFAGMAGGGVDASGLVSTTVGEVFTPVSTPGGSQYGNQLAGPGFALLNATNAAQIAALQAALEEPEHLSFSLWDVNTPGAYSAAQGQSLSSLSSLAAGLMPPASTHPAHFTGFDAATAAAAAASGGTTLQNLAAAAADRLVYSHHQQQQHQQQQQQLAAQLQALAAARQSSAAGMQRPSSSSGDNNSPATRQALLHAWVSAASAAAAFEAGPASAEQQLLEMIGGDGAAGSNLVGLSSNTVQCMACDMCGALAPADVLRLVQQLQRQLQERGIFN